MKIQNFLCQLREMNLSNALFCSHTNSYFTHYQVPRKQTQIDFMKEKVKAEQAITVKLQQMETSAEPFKNLNAKSTPLQQFFMLYLNRTKEEIRQRKMLNQLTNTKSIRKEQLDLNKLDHVLMGKMKA